jgi:hypothetical protein
MKDNVAIAVAVAGLLSLFAIVIWWRISVWNECRADHSIMYCLTMMSGR